VGLVAGSAVWCSTRGEAPARTAQALAARRGCRAGVSRCLYLVGKVGHDRLGSEVHQARACRCLWRRPGPRFRLGLVPDGAVRGKAEGVHSHVDALSKGEL
jgi:hypothetical protein